MAKVTKATREIVDIDQEIEKVTASKKKKQNEKKEIVSKKEQKKKNGKLKKEKSGILQFFKEVRKEMSKVKWPSRKDMVKYSIATISFVIFFAIFFYVIEMIMALLKAWV